HRSRQFNVARMSAGNAPSVQPGPFFELDVSYVHVSVDRSAVRDGNPGNPDIAFDMARSEDLDSIGRDEIPCDLSGQEDVLRLDVPVDAPELLDVAVTLESNRPLHCANDLDVAAALDLPVEDQALGNDTRLLSLHAGPVHRRASPGCVPSKT